MSRGFRDMGTTAPCVVGCTLEKLWWFGSVNSSTVRFVHLNRCRFSRKSSTSRKPREVGTLPYFVVPKIYLRSHEKRPTRRRRTPPTEEPMGRKTVARERHTTRLPK